MRRKTTILASLALSAVALTMGMTPAQSQEAKSGLPAAGPDEGVLEAEASAGRAASARANRGAEAALDAIQANIRRWVEKNGPQYSFASYLDDSTGRIVLKTDAPGRLVSSLLNSHADKVDVSAATTTDLFSRRDDIPAYWGGAGIKANGSLCSNGFTVKNSAGTRFMTTAGHCFANGSTVLTELGNRTVGTVSSRGLPSYDMEKIGGQSYAGRIYTGGTNSTSSLPVTGAGDAVVGYANYCHSGRTTGEHCGHKATSNTAQVCTSSGCKYPVTAFTGGTLPQPGDSGSPFYVKDSTKVWIRGHVIAGDGTTSYAEKYSRIASYLGVSIVTSA